MKISPKRSQALSLSNFPKLPPLHFFLVFWFVWGFFSGGGGEWGTKEKGCCFGIFYFCSDFVFSLENVFASMYLSKCYRLIHEKKSNEYIFSYVKKKNWHRHKG